MIMGTHKNMIQKALSKKDGSILSIGINALQVEKNLVMGRKLLLGIYFFVLSLFVIGCGLTCLETSANPYTTVLGHPDKAESRINLSQSLNGLQDCWLADSFCSRVSTLPSLMHWWVSLCFLWHQSCQGSSCRLSSRWH